MDEGARCFAVAILEAEDCPAAGLLLSPVAPT